MADKLNMEKDGFNQGYILAKHAPELYQLIVKDQHPKDGYFSAFMNGGTEYQHEQSSPFKKNHMIKNKEKDIKIEK